MPIRGRGVKLGQAYALMGSEGCEGVPGVSQTRRSVAHSVRPQAGRCGTCTLPPAGAPWVATNPVRRPRVPAPGNTVVAGYGPTLASSAFYMQPVFVTQGPRPPRRQAGPPRSGVQPSNGDPRATDLPPAPYAAPQGAAAVPLAGNTSSLTQQLAGSSGDPIAMNVFIRDFYLQLVGLAVGGHTGAQAVRCRSQASKQGGGGGHGRMRCPRRSPRTWPEAETLPGKADHLTRQVGTAQPTLHTQVHTTGSPAVLGVRRQGAQRLAPAQCSRRSVTCRPGMAWCDSFSPVPDFGPVGFAGARLPPGLLFWGENRTFQQPRALPNRSTMLLVARVKCESKLLKER